MPPSPPPFVSPTVSVVIPAMNDESNLSLVLEGLPYIDEIIVVDGGSSDGTAAVARTVRPDAVVVRPTRSGRGNALIRGFAASTGDIVVTLSADGSTDPAELPGLVGALLAGAEVAHGSRYREGGADLAGRRRERLGNALLSRLVNAAFDTRFTDLSWGYNAYWRSVLPVLDLPGARRGRGDGDEIGPLIVIRAAARGLRVAEVASVRYPPVNGTRNRRPLRRAMRTLVSEWLRRRRLGRRQPARHDTTTMAGYGQPAAPSRPVHPETARVAVPPLVRPAVPDPAPYLAGGRATGRAGAPPGRRRGHPEATPWTTPEPGAHRRPEAGANGIGAHHREQQRIAPPESGGYRTGGYDTGVRHSGLYDTGVHRIGVYDSGVHRTDTYEFALDQPATGRREVGGGRRRLDAGDRRAGGRPDLTVIPGEGSRPADEGDDAGGWEPEPRPRPGHLRFLPGEQFDR